MTLIRPITGGRIPTGWFGQLWDEIMSNRVRGDGRTVAVIRTPTGAVITSINRGGFGGAGPRSGMFTISATETGQFKVQDPNAKLTAGIAQINGTFYTVPTAEFAVSATCYVYVRYTLPTQDEAAPGDTAEIITDAELLQPNERYAYGLIGRVIVDGEQKTISQDHAPGTMIMWWQGPCWEEEE